jgi:hypothetical protein
VLALLLGLNSIPIRRRGEELSKIGSDVKRIIGSEREGFLPQNCSPIILT